MMKLPFDIKRAALNGVCPYFTMFPLDFPYTILNVHASSGEWVLDPFCGRGTTNYASRLLGLPSVGIDSSPVAVALSQAKLANTSPQMIVRVAQRILVEIETPGDVPAGEFWEWAFNRDVLQILCRLREGLLRNCQSDARKALRAIIMGALHGPRPKSHPAYFSNQSPRTYGPKPRYAVNFWKARNLVPEFVDVLKIIEERAQRFYSQEFTVAVGAAIQGDSRDKRLFSHMPAYGKVSWVITSPPYYGMRTYLPDQWLRLWFLGGKPNVDYSTQGQVNHASPEIFASQLRQVWLNVGTVCTPGARMVVRFGSINDRRVDALSILSQSLQNSGWEVHAIEAAGSASAGRRQALHFSRSNKKAIEEQDVWATWTG